MRIATIAAVVTGLAAAPGAAPAQDPGLAYNNHCRTCHSRDEGDHRLGPSLHAVVGREAGSLDGFRYSAALEDAGFEWTRERLDAYIANPDKVVPGNNMEPYGGINDPDIREAIIEALEEG